MNRNPTSCSKYVESDLMKIWNESDGIDKSRFLSLADLDKKNNGKKDKIITEDELKKFIESGCEFLQNTPPKKY